MKAYRDQNPTYAERNRKMNAARRRAERDLARRHPVEFAILFEEHKRQLGLIP